MKRTVHRLAHLHTRSQDLVLSEDIPIVTIRTHGVRRGTNKEPLKTSYNPLWKDDPSL